jgi:sialidase-1
MLTPPLVWTALAFLASAPADAADAPREVTVFTSGESGYRVYRIPAVVATAKGTLLAFAEGRRNGADDSGDIDIVLRRSSDGGATWGPTQLVADAGEDTVGNPCPVFDRDTGRVWLPLTRNPGRNSTPQNLSGTGTGSREVFLCHSDDDGATWSRPVNITAQVKRNDWKWYATGPGCGVQLRDGRLVIPCDHRTATSGRVSFSHVIFSDDHGKTWRIGGAAAERTNECQVVELADGRLVLNMRSHAGRNRRAVAVSADRGATWGETTFDETLIEPVCQGSLIRLPGGPGDRLLFANPAGTKRERLTVRLSPDGGKTWPAARVLCPGAAAYSSLVALPDGRAGCFYEKGRPEALVFARFGLGWLAAGRESPRP